MTTFQALIDFDGWRRWKGSDPKEGQTKQGFQVGPQQAARNLAGRLHIDRSKAVPAAPAEANSQSPEVSIQLPTPEGGALDPQPDPMDGPATSLKVARSELVENRLPTEGTTAAEVNPLETSPMMAKMLSAINEDVESSPAFRTFNLPKVHNELGDISESALGSTSPDRGVDEMPLPP